MSDHHGSTSQLRSEHDGKGWGTVGHGEPGRSENCLTRRTRPHETMIGHALEDIYGVIQEKRQAMIWFGLFWFEDGSSVKTLLRAVLLLVL